MYRSIDLFMYFYKYILLHIKVHIGVHFPDKTYRAVSSITQRTMSQIRAECGEWSVLLFISKYISDHLSLSLVVSHLFLS